VVRTAVEAVCRELMESEVSELVGAELGERRPDERMTHRNGYRVRAWQTHRSARLKGRGAPISQPRSAVRRSHVACEPRTLAPRPL
jgi:hypothetical protein